MTSTGAPSSADPSGTPRRSVVRAPPRTSSPARSVAPVKSSAMHPRAVAMASSLRRMRGRCGAVYTRSRCERQCENAALAPGAEMSATGRRRMSGRPLRSNAAKVVAFLLPAHPFEKGGPRVQIAVVEPLDELRIDSRLAAGQGPKFPGMHRAAWTMRVPFFVSASSPSVCHPTPPRTSSDPPSVLAVPTHGKHPSTELPIFSLASTTSPFIVPLPRLRPRMAAFHFHRSCRLLRFGPEPGPNVCQSAGSKARGMHPLRSPGTGPTRASVLRVSIRSAECVP